MKLSQMFLHPFKKPRLRFYLGKIKQGTPIFFPRVVDKKTREFKSVKWLHFQYIPLGWKIKWDGWDFRFEWNPMISIVFCHLQFCIWIVPPKTRADSIYWECLLAYYKAKRILPTTASKEEVIKYAKMKCPQVWNIPDKEKAGWIKIDYWEEIL